MMPSFLELPARPGKPRSAGLTHVLDAGVDLPTVAGLLRAAGEYIDVWKLGWGTAYVDPTVTDKLALLADHQVISCLGGTMLEIAWTQGKADACLDWARQAGFAAVEVSRGVAAMTVPEKHRLIRRAAAMFTVLAEVGRKDRSEQLPARQWVDEIEGDRDAGARWVIAEGRASGTVGLYRDDGSVRGELVAAIARAAGLDELFFEAPRTSQQAWFMHQFGPEVNLANIATCDAIGLETLRLGLRADTFEPSRQWQPA